MNASESLPDDVESLQQLVLAQRAQITTHKVEVELLRLQIARLRRMKFGHSSEKIEAQINQLELLIEELETIGGALPAAVSVAAATFFALRFRPASIMSRSHYLKAFASGC